MKRLIFAVVTVISLLNVSSLHAQRVSSLALDYDVPESPAFVILGINPSKVYGTGSTKPLMVSLANTLLTGEKLGSGYALDFAPFQSLIDTRIRSIAQYRNSALAWLSKLKLSAGTLSPNGDTNRLRIAAGARWVLYDDHDPIYDDTLVRAVGIDLANATSAPSFNSLDSIGNSTIPSIIRVNVPSLAVEYAKARERIASHSGFGLAIGFGIADDYRYDSGYTSFANSAAWLSLSLYRPLPDYPLDILGTAQMHAMPDSNFVTAGIALRGSSDLMMINAEAIYSSLTKSIGGAATLELKLITGVRAILGADLTRIEGSDRYRFHTTGSFKYDLAN
jgi:hypothetical protein